MYINILYFAEYAVAPLVGAWIETDYTKLAFTMFDLVAPLVGAWIETDATIDINPQIKSHPSWVRGLKHDTRMVRKNLFKSHPSWVRGLKHNMTTY